MKAIEVTDGSIILALEPGEDIEGGGFAEIEICLGAVKARYLFMRNYAPDGEPIGYVFEKIEDVTSRMHETHDGTARVIQMPDSLGTENTDELPHADVS